MHDHPISSLEGSRGVTDLDTLSGEIAEETQVPARSNYGYI